MKTLHTRTTLLILLAVALPALLAGSAAAAPSYYGYTGLLVTPTADALDAGDFSLGGVFISRDRNDTTVLSANLGLAQSLEAGVAMVDPEFGKTRTLVNAKYRFLPETGTQPALAFGVSDITGEIDSTPYLALSKSLDWQGSSLRAPRVHVGVGGGRLDGVFAGLSAAVTKSTLLMVEYDTNDLNFGAQWAASNEIRIHAGLLAGENLGLGMSYNKGF